MAVAVDALGAGTTWNNEQNKTWLHTASGSNRYVVTTVAHAQGATNYSSSQTYDSVALSALSQQVNGLALAEIWGLAAPNTGSGLTVAVNMAQGGHYGTGNSASFTEVAQTGSSDAPETFTITAATSDSQAFATASGDAVVSVVSLEQGGANAVTTGTAIMTGVSDLGYGGPAAYALATGATATLAYSWGNTVLGVHTGVNLNQAAAGGATGYGRLLGGARNTRVMA